MQQRANDGKADTAANSRQVSEDATAESGWVTTKVAAAAIGVSPRSVRDYIRQGKLEAKHQGEGVNKSWYVTISSVQALREERRTSGETTRARREEEAAEKMAEIAAAEHGNVFRELLSRVESNAAEAAALKARLELTAKAESTLRENLEEAREKADRAEHRAKELEAKLALSQEALQATEKVPEGTGKGNIPQKPQSSNKSGLQTMTEILGKSGKRTFGLIAFIAAIIGIATAINPGGNADQTWRIAILLVQLTLYVFAIFLILYSNKEVGRIVLIEIIKRVRNFLHYISGSLIKRRA